MILSKVVVGCWQAGKKYWPGVQDQEVVCAYEYALENGFTSFDTALNYGNGMSECLLAKAFRKKRNEVQYLTKVYCDQLHYEGVIKSCERSLKNLKTDFIDLYQIHWPSGSWNSPYVNIEETCQAFLKLQEVGKIKNIGVCNFSLEQIIEIRKYIELYSVQNPCSPLFYQEQMEIQKYCLNEKIVYMSYSSLAHGFLSGHYNKDSKFKSGDNRLRSYLLQIENRDRLWNIVNKFLNFCNEIKVDPVSIILQWLQKKEIVPIVGVKSKNHIESFFKTKDLDLLCLEKLDEIFQDDFKLLNILWKINQ